MACIGIERLRRPDVDEEGPPRAARFRHRHRQVLFRIVERLERAVVDADDEQTPVGEVDSGGLCLRHFSRGVLSRDLSAGCTGESPPRGSGGTGRRTSLRLELRQARVRLDDKVHGAGNRCFFSTSRLVLPQVLGVHPTALSRLSLRNLSHILDVLRCSENPRCRQVLATLGAASLPTRKWRNWQTHQLEGVV